MASKIRTFVAVELHDEARGGALALVDRLRSATSSVKWVEPDHLHLTLKFLGDVDANDLPDICRQVTAAAKEFEPIEIECHGAGAFPKLTHPRTLWLGVRQGAAELVQLARAIEQRLERLGFPREARQYQPHVTLGRVRGTSSHGQELAERLGKLSDYAAGYATIDEVIVFSSELLSEGPRYTPLAHVPLGGD